MFMHSFLSCKTEIELIKSVSKTSICAKSIWVDWLMVHKIIKKVLLKAIISTVNFTNKQLNK